MIARLFGRRFLSDLQLSRRLRDDFLSEMRGGDLLKVSEEWWRDCRVVPRLKSLFGKAQDGPLRVFVRGWDALGGSSQSKEVPLVNQSGTESDRDN